jgi:2-dehydro-3-deoxygluconokinase
MPSMAEVVTLGECLIALVAEAPGPLAESPTFSRHVAGAEANFAVGLARLGHGVAYIGRVGADGFGTTIVRRLRGEGVEVRFVRTDDAPTGLMVRERRTLGPADVLYYRSGSAGSRLGPDDVDQAAGDGVFAQARWLHVTGITPALAETARAAVGRAIELAREAGCTVSLDLNLRRRLWSDEQAAPVLRELTSRVDVVFGGADEANVVGGTADPDGLLALGPRFAVVKLGIEGAQARESAGEPVRVRAVPVQSVLDPVGAGDAFCAGFVAARLEGGDLREALEVGCACGASAVAAVGDLTGLPTREEVARLRSAVPSDDTIR